MTLHLHKYLVGNKEYRHSRCADPSRRKKRSVHSIPYCEILVVPVPFVVYPDKASQQSGNVSHTPTTHQE